MSALAGDTPLLEVDHDSRARIRDDLHRNLFVEAGAGTGKTRVLVDRVVRLVATGTVREIGNLVAITFTEAAAAELRDRVRRALELAAVDAQLPAVERSRCAVARERLDTATITTLHGFAHRVLAEYPLDAGLPPAFEVEDDVQARVRFNDRWKRFRDDLFADPSFDRDLLIAQALRLATDSVHDLAKLLHDRWDRLVGVEFPVPPLPAVDARRIVAAIEEVAVVAQPQVELDGDMLADVVSWWLNLRYLLEDGLAAGDELEIVRVLSAEKNLPKPGNKGRREVWGEAKAPTIAALTEAVEATTSLLCRLRTAVIERLLPRLAAFTLDGVDERKREGRLEFHDLLVHARDLLRSNEAVRSALSERIDVILIDEFQDTDPLQLDIAFALAADDPSVEPPTWEEAILKPGKVLLVGDPKQSIYRFRGADISLWDRTKRLFPDGVERLGQNFRTVAPLLEWVNSVFGAVIAEGAEGVQPRYEDLAPFRPDVRDAAVVVVGERVPEARAIELREQEADDLSRLIVTMKVEAWPVFDGRADDGWRPTRFDDIAVLVPTRTPLRQLERALDRHDIPYRIESRSLVWATDAVREVLSILSAIDDPGDRVAIVAALRSPGFACSDIDLLEWKRAGGRWDHQANRPDDIPEDHPVAVGMAALAHFHALRSELPINVLVERVVREQQLVELTFVQRRPRDHWRRLRFVVDQARAFVESGGGSLGDFVSWAQLQTDENAAVVEAPAPEPDDDAVRILTIHGSKGLEFPVVVLAGLSSKQYTSGPTAHYGDGRPEVAVGPKDARFATPGYDVLADAAADAEAHEAKRLLYVAATRARDHLVISLHHAAKGQSAKSAAALLWDASHEAAAAWWRHAVIGDQLSLPVDAGSGGFEPMSSDERAAWLRERDEVLAASTRRRVWAATALAGEAGDLEPVEPAHRAVDGEAEPGAPQVPLHRGGTALGRAVHAVLQSVDFDDPTDVAALAAVEAAREGLTVTGDADEVARRAAGALASAVVLEARAAANNKRWRELYVAAPMGPSAAATGAGALVEGYIDLLFEDERGELVVVDYKTDRATTADGAAEVGSRYRLQAGAYALAVGEVLHRPVTRAVLVFCGRDGAIEYEIDDLRDAIDQARAIATGSAAG